MHVVVNSDLKAPNIATIMAKNLLWAFAVIGLSLANHAQAQIGRTIEECRQAYGSAIDHPSGDGTYIFTGKRTVPEIPIAAPDFKFYAPEMDYYVTAEFVDGRASIITYLAAGADAKMYVLDAEYLLKHSAPKAVWNEPVKHTVNADGKVNGAVYWDGSVNGVVKYHARLEGLSLEITDEATNAGGVKGAKREIINGQSFTVLPYQGSDDKPNQNVASTLAPTPAKLTIESAEADLNRAWKSLTSQQRDRLSQEERNWTHHRDSLPAEERIKSTADRAKYLWSFVERSFDD
jgi:hypothetical protein